MLIWTRNWVKMIDDAADGREEVSQFGREWRRR
jgi:hypothetical protein